MAAEKESEVPEVKPFSYMVYKGHCFIDTLEVDDLPGFKCRDDDVWVCSFPRSGTTLTQQITYLVSTLDFEKARTVQLDERFPFIDLVEPAYPFFKGLKHVDQLPETSPRFIKTHLPYKFLPDQLKSGKGKIIYITRNPKASIVSCYKMQCFMKQPGRPTLREYVDDLIDGRIENTVTGAPWEKNFRSYWELKDDPNVLFIQFEKLVKDRRGIIEKIASFLGKDLSKEHVDRIVEETSLESMRNNDAVNFIYFEDSFKSDKSHGGFINTGDESRWRRELTDDLIQKMDKLIREITKDTDIVFE